MSHPETYYDAKRALRAAAKDTREYLADRTADAFLAALGWSTPDPIRNDQGRIVKVYKTELRHALPRAFLEEHLDGRRTYNIKYTGYLVGATKQDVGDRTSSKHWSKTQRSAGVSPVDVTDLAYPIAVVHPEHAVIVITGDGAPDSEPILFPLADLQVPR